MDIPIIRKSNRFTMYVLVTKPLVLVGAISTRYKFVETVSIPAPNPLQSLANKINP